MSNHRSLISTSDVASRLTAGSSHVFHGRFHVQLLFSAVAAFGVFISFQGSLQAAEQESPAAVQQEAETQPEKEADPLLALVDEALTKNSQRFLDARKNSPWEMAHGLVALRRDLQLRDGDKMVNAIDWLSNKSTYKGTPIFEATKFGARARPYNGVMYDFEGHINQTLALLSMSNLPITHEFTLTDGRKVTMADMVNHTKMTANREEETTWTLWFLTNYLDPEAEWTNQWGHNWSMAALVLLQNRVEVTKAACGGTHNLFALAYARNAYYQKHGRLRGVWLEADQKIQDHLRIVRQLQNADGSFSSNFFKGRGHSVDPNERMKSTGHNLEWIMMALPAQRLNEEWVRSAVRSLAVDLIRTAPYPADYGHGGPMYHAIDALVLYRQRVSEPSTFQAASPIASLKAAAEARSVAAAPKQAPATTTQAAPKSPVASVPKVDEPTSNPVATAPKPETSPKPLTLTINGRPVRVAELPSTGVSDSPAVPLAPLETPPALKAPEPLKTAVEPAPIAGRPASPQQSASQESEPGIAMEKPLEETPSTNAKPAEPSVEFASPIPVPQPEIIPAQPKASEPSLTKPEETTTESKTPSTTTPESPKSEEGDSGMTADDSVEPVTPVIPPASPKPPVERERPRVSAPRDVFVPLRRRYLPSRR